MIIVIFTAILGLPAMFENRISQHLPVVAAEALPSASGFMACPGPLVQGWPTDRQAWLAHVYRVALERAIADAQPSPWLRRIMTASEN
jgi:hypothetical protein